MSDPKVMTLPGAFALAKQGLFPTRDALVGVTEHGAALYAWDRTLIVRPAGIKPEGIQVYRAGMNAANVDPVLIGMAEPRRNRSRKGGFKHE